MGRKGKDPLWVSVDGSDITGHRGRKSRRGVGLSESLIGDSLSEEDSTTTDFYSGGHTGRVGESGRSLSGGQGCTRRSRYGSLLEPKDPVSPSDENGPRTTSTFCTGRHLMSVDFG